MPTEQVAKSVANMTEIKCPKCGNTDISTIELCHMMPTFRKIYKVTPPDRPNGEWTFVLGSDVNDNYEGTFNLTCVKDKCFEDFPMPKNWTW